jgi:hypothetical protein
MIGKLLFGERAHCGEPFGNGLGDFNADLTISGAHDNIGAVIGWITAAHGQRKCKPVGLGESREQLAGDIRLGVVRLAPVGPCRHRNIDTAERHYEIGRVLDVGEGVQHSGTALLRAEMARFT